MQKFRELLTAGSIQLAYRFIIDFMNAMRARFVRMYGESGVSGLYQGFMDMTYFAVLTPKLKDHDLKVAVVFNYSAFRFEAWLSARNRKIQKQTWQLFNQGDWKAYRVVPPEKGIDSIVECDLVTDPDFEHPDKMAGVLEKGVEAFIPEMEAYLSTHILDGTKTS